MNIKITQIEPDIDEQEIEYVTQALRDKWITEGRFAEKFLTLIKEQTKAKYAILANNGTLALFLSLLALDIKAKDEVIIPNFTFIASATSVAFAGAKPVFVDVNRDNYTIDTKKIEEAITEKTKAIMPVHIYGQSADMDKIMEIAQKYKLKVIEDAAQGYGVLYKGKHTGTIGDIGTISFFADKTITTGEGAVILTNNEEYKDKLLYLRNQGRLSSGTFTHPQLGMNFRLTDLQCAVGVAQAEKFEKIKLTKLKNHRRYKELLMDNNNISFTKEMDYTNIIPFRTNIIANHAKELMQYMEENGVQTRGFFYPLNKQPCFQVFGYNGMEFPVSDYLYENGVSLPVHNGLKEEDILYICNLINLFYKEYEV